MIVFKQNPLWLSFGTGGPGSPESAGEAGGGRGGGSSRSGSFGDFGSDVFGGGYGDFGSDIFGGGYGDVGSDIFGGMMDAMHGRAHGMARAAGGRFSGVVDSYDQSLDDNPRGFFETLFEPVSRIKNKIALQAKLLTNPEYLKSYIDLVTELFTEKKPPSNPYDLSRPGPMEAQDIPTNWAEVAPLEARVDALQGVRELGVDVPQDLISAYADEAEAAGLYNPQTMGQGLIGPGSGVAMQPAVARTLFELGTPLGYISPITTAATGLLSSFIEDQMKYGQLDDLQRQLQGRPFEPAQIASKTPAAKDSPEPAGRRMSGPGLFASLFSQQAQRASTESAPVQTKDQAPTASRVRPPGKMASRSKFFTRSGTIGRVDDAFNVHRMILGGA